MNKIKEFIEDMDIGLKLVLIGLMLFGSCLFTFSLLEFGICKNLQSVYDDPSNVRYTWPGGCLIRMPSGYWVHYDDINSLELLNENK